MQENLQNDRFESFLKKAFEHFEKNPSDDVWNRIEQNLPTSGVHVVAVNADFISVKKSWLAAAASLWLILQVAQWLYFHHRMNHLEQEWQQPPAGISAAAPEKSPAFDEKLTENSAAFIPPTTIGTLRDAIVSPNPAGISRQQFAAVAAGKTMATATTVTDTQHANTLAADRAAALDPKMISPAPENTLHSTTVDPLPPSLAQLREIKWLSTAPVRQVRRAAPAPALVVLPPVRPVREADRWLEVHAGSFSTYSRARFDRSKFPRHHDKHLTHDGKLQGQTQIMGLGWEKKIAPNLSFVSGVDFRQAVMQHTFKIDFRFKDRVKAMTPPGAPPHRHNFNFNLNTGGGAAEMEFLVLQADASAQINDDEPLNFQAENQQTLRWLSIPAALKWRSNGGRWRIHLKGGIAANYLIFNHFELKNVRLDNLKFKIDHKKPAHRKKEPMQTITLDWLASAGLEYRFSRPWSISLEPSLRGDLTDYLNLPFAKTNHLLQGIRVGLRYTLP